MVGNPLIVLATPPAGLVVATARLYFRSAGRRPFDSLDLTPGTPYQATFPDSVITPRGIEYYVSFSDGQQTVTSPENTPALAPAVVRVKVATIVTPQQLQRRGYRMVSVPLELAEQTIPSVFFDDYGSYDRSRWRVFHWENGANLEHPAFTERMMPGNAFWLITHSGLGFDVDNARSVNSALPATIALPPGWSQIANPYFFRVAWDSIVNSGRVRGPFYYDNGQYVPGVNVLNPWEGYFVRNDSSSPLTLTVPAIEAPPGLLKFSTPSERFPSAKLIVQLSASSSEGRDTYNYVGFVDGASEGDDMFDLPEPPSMGDQLSLVVVEGGRTLAAEFTPLPTDGRHWDIEVRCAALQGSVRVGLTPVGEFPPGFDLYVFDIDQETALPIIGGGCETPFTGPGLRHLRVIIGTEEYARSRSNRIPLQPVEYELAQNYPNPFNPATTIRYQISKRGHVSLEVFNTLGQRVRTLVSGDQRTGSYSVVWNGLSDDGIPVASGTYLYRLTAAEFISSRKLILLR
jgi:hypothetical protein